MPQSAQSGSAPSPPDSSTRSPAVDLVREAGVALAAILGISAIRDLAVAGRIDGTHALVGICVIVVPGAAAFGAQLIAGLARRPPPR
jgi:hypothetical protein